MAYKNITTSRDGSSFIITFNRPQRRNAISIATMDELIDAAQTADQEADVPWHHRHRRQGILLGRGGFERRSRDQRRQRWPRLFQALAQALRRFENLSKPALAAIEGFCMTGGCEFALACDIRIAGEGSTFAITSAKIGTVAGAGGTQRLARLVGAAKAIEIMFSADPIDATEAHRIGLINRKVAKGSALDEAKAMIRGYENRAPLSLAFIKRVVYRGLQMDLASALEFEAFLVTTIYGSEDRKEGISAFLEKRQAKFKGK